MKKILRKLGYIDYRGKIDRGEIVFDIVTVTLLGGATWIVLN